MHKKADRYRDWEFARDALRKILRSWSIEFSSLELRTALFVYDRTVGWGKEWEVVTVEHAAMGVWGEKGECWAAPITKDKARARQALKNLVDKGFLYRRERQNTFEYSLNLDDMKIPKRMAEEGVRFRTFEGCDFASKRSAISHPKEYIIERRESKEKRSASASHSADIGESQNIEEAKQAVERVVIRAKARRELRKKNGKFERRANGTESGFVPFKSSFPSVWFDLYSRYFPETAKMPISAIGLKILHSYAKNWTHLREEGEFLDYLSWIFENWQVLRAGPFKWMTDFPVAPSPRIVLNAKLRPLIEETYQHREWWARWAKLGEYERRVQHLVINKGMDLAKAESIAKKETGFRDEIRLLKEEQRKLEIAAARVKQAYSQERAALRKQQQAVGRPTLQDVEGDFGRWDNEN